MPTRIPTSVAQTAPQTKARAFADIEALSWGRWASPLVPSSGGASQALGVKLPGRSWAKGKGARVPGARLPGVTRVLGTTDCSGGLPAGASFIASGLFLGVIRRSIAESSLIGSSSTGPGGGGAGPFGGTREAFNSAIAIFLEGAAGSGTIAEIGDIAGSGILGGGTLGGGTLGGGTLGGDTLGGDAPQSAPVNFVEARWGMTGILGRGAGSTGARGAGG
mmetsp:Transcript_48107/g.94433  ORF Transcript_48107/g.94433 Transcript_48107/m.94433 type:complete len:220 (+) Transcript_48107:727-1386(+)